MEFPEFKIRSYEVLIGEIVKNEGVAIGMFVWEVTSLKD